MRTQQTAPFKTAESFTLTEPVTCRDGASTTVLAQNFSFTVVRAHCQGVEREVVLEEVSMWIAAVCCVQLHMRHRVCAEAGSTCAR